MSGSYAGRSVTGFVYFSQDQPAEKYDLRELLYWRAFRRLPEEFWDEDGPWRFSPNIRESAKGPVPQNPCLTGEKCRFSGIPMGRRTSWIINDTMLLDAGFYRRQVDKVRSIQI